MIAYKFAFSNKWYLYKITSIISADVVVEISKGRHFKPLLFAEMAVNLRTMKVIKDRSTGCSGQIISTTVFKNIIQHREKVGPLELILLGDRILNRKGDSDEI